MEIESQTEEKSEKSAQNAHIHTTKTRLGGWEGGCRERLTAKGAKTVGRCITIFKANNLALMDSA